MQRRKWLQHMTYMADCEEEGIPLEKSAAMNTDITDQSSTCRAVASSLKMVRPYSVVITILAYSLL